MILDESRFWVNVVLGECRLGRMSSWVNVGLGDWFLGKSILGGSRNRQTSFGRTSGNPPAPSPDPSPAPAPAPTPAPAPAPSPAPAPAPDRYIRLSTAAVPSPVLFSFQSRHKGRNRTLELTNPNTGINKSTTVKICESQLDHCGGSGLK